MTGAQTRRKARKNATQATVETEDGTQADRPRNKLGKKKSVHNRKPVVVTGLKEINDAVLKEFVTKTCELGVKGIMDEFVTLRNETQTCTRAKTAHEKNADRNRYKDVFCIDDTRLVLKYPEDSTQDYIHANWVKLGEANKFICTQGPTEKTVEDFWRVVWQEKSPCILMLCNIMELGKKKCEQYWNETDKLTLLGGKLTVKVTEPPKEVEQNIMLIKIQVSDDKGATHTLDHWQWKAWPDRGVPEIPMAVFRLLFKLKTASPIIVHCSAGIGRTGTVVGLDIAYAKLVAGEKVSLNQIVREIRTQRHGSVQTDAQYLFMHRVLIALAETKKIATPEVAAFVVEYDKVIATKA